MGSIREPMRGGLAELPPTPRPPPLKGERDGESGSQVSAQADASLAVQIWRLRSRGNDPACKIEAEMAIRQAAIYPKWYREVPKRSTKDPVATPKSTLQRNSPRYRLACRCIADQHRQHEPTRSNRTQSRTEGSPNRHAADSPSTVILAAPGYRHMPVRISPGLTACPMKASHDPHSDGTRQAQEDMFPQLGAHTPPAH